MLCSPTYLAIDLCRRDVSMAHQLLYRTQFHAFAQHQDRERVAQAVRRDIGNAGLTRVTLDDQPEALARETLAVMVEEERLLFGVAGSHLRARLGQVMASSFKRGL